MDISGAFPIKAGGHHGPFESPTGCPLLRGTSPRMHVPAVQGVEIDSINIARSLCLIIYTSSRPLHAEELSTCFLGHTCSSVLEIHHLLSRDMQTERLVLHLRVVLSLDEVDIHHTSIVGTFDLVTP